MALSRMAATNTESFSYLLYPLPYLAQQLRMMQNLPRRLRCGALTGKVSRCSAMTAPCGSNLTGALDEVPRLNESHPTAPELLGLDFFHPSHMQPWEHPASLALQTLRDEFPCCRELAQESAEPQ